MKKYLAAFLCLILAFTMVACSSGNEPAQEPSEESAEPANEYEAIMAAGAIKVGIEGTFRPYTYHAEDGSLTGFDVELAQAIAEKLGIEVEFTEAGWDSLLAGVDSGRLDTVINTVGITDTRKEKYDFVGPYLYIPKQVVVRSDNDSIHSVDDLAGKKVATNMTSTTGEMYAAYGAEIVNIDGVDQSAQTVLSGRADFCNFEPATLKDYLEQHPDAELKVAFLVPGLSEEYGIPFRKGETEIVEAVSKALEELRAEGKLAELSEKYLGGDYTNPVE